MFDETVIIPDGWSEKFPLQKLVDKAESYLRSRGVKDANDKKKYEKKQDRRKTFQNDKYKDTDLQGRVRNKLPQDGPPQLMQQQPKAATPTKSTEDSAEYELHGVEQVSIKPGETNKIITGVNVHVPQGSFGFITDRSIMATKYDIIVPTDTIYCYYTGKFSVVLHNQSKTNFYIKEFMRIAQLLVI